MRLKAEGVVISLELIVKINPKSIYFCLPPPAFCLFSFQADKKSDACINIKWLKLLEMIMDF
jgi:hypothetical protein